MQTVNAALFLPKLEKCLLWGYIALFLAMPWSVETNFGAWKMYLPTEPLIVLLGLGLLVWVLLKKPFTGWNGAKDLYKKNNFLLAVSMLWVIWMGITAFFSTMPLVSGKYLLVEAGQWWVFFVGIYALPAVWRKALPFYLASMLGVVVYAIAKHAGYHFLPHQSNLSVMPFFPDHTMYAAVLAMLLPWAGRACFVGQPTLHKGTKMLKGSWVGLFSIALLLAGLYFSFCRAAWLSVVLTFGLGAMVFFWKKWRWFLGIGLCLMCFSGVWLLKTPTSTLGTNDDGNASGLQAQWRSMANFSTDVSNLERLNRYACAGRMAADQPFWGFGPGTFPFAYIPYQRPEEMTRISVNAPIEERNSSNYGRGGGAHSEYWQALAEMGWPGLLLWCALVLGAAATGIRRAKADNQAARQFYWIVLLSLTTFFLHGLVNNFLHDGKVALLVWAQLAVLARTE